MQDRRDLQSELQRLVETLRSHYDDAVISTRVAHCDERAIIAHASIVTGAGPSGSGLGSAPSEDGAAEQAENRAILRALIALGVPVPADEPAKLTGPTAVDPPGRVVQFPTHEPEPPQEDPFDEDPAAPTRPTRPAQEPASSPRSTAPAAMATPGTVPVGSAPTTAATPPVPARTPAPQAATDDDPDPADLSWNGFWRWAREHGFSNRMALEDALKQPLGSRPPAEVRQLMREQLNIDG